MAKANWTRAPFNTNARNATPRNGNRKDVASSKVDTPVEPSKPAAVAIFLRCSGIEFMYRHGDISLAQKNAADRFHGLHVAANANDLQGMDYSRIRVDGGQPGSGGMIDRRLRARDELQRVRVALGERAFTVLSVAAGEEGGLNAVAEAIGKSKATAGRSVGPALEALSRHWEAEGAGDGIRVEVG